MGTWKLSFRFLDVYQILGLVNGHFHKVYEKIESNFNVTSIRSSQYLSTNPLPRSEFTNERGHFALGGLAGAKMTNEKMLNSTMELVNIKVIEIVIRKLP